MHPELVRTPAVWACDGLLAATVICWVAASVRVFHVAAHRQAAMYLVASLAAAFGAVRLADGFRTFHLVPSYPMFPSGHEAFTTSIGASMVIAAHRWLPVAIVLGLLMVPALVWAGYHKWPDAIASAIYSPLLTLAVHRLFRTRVPQWQPTNSSQ